MPKTFAEMLESASKPPRPGSRPYPEWDPETFSMAQSGRVEPSAFQPMDMIGPPGVSAMLRGGQALGRSALRGASAVAQPSPYVLEMLEQARPLAAGALRTTAARQAGMQKYLAEHEMAKQLGAAARPGQGPVVNSGPLTLGDNGLNYPMVLKLLKALKTTAQQQRAEAPAMADDLAALGPMRVPPGPARIPSEVPYSPPASIAQVADDIAPLDPLMPAAASAPPNNIINLLKKRGNTTKR